MATAKKDPKQAALVSRHDVSIKERFRNDDLRSIQSLEDAMALVVGAYGEVKSIEDFELGTGFKLVKDDEKGRLVGVPFLVLHFQFNEGDFGEFASVTLITMDKNQDKLILNDGSTGICDQLRDIAETGQYGGFTVPKGLRKSDYDTCKECGKPRKPSENPCSNCEDTSEQRAKGTTFYFDLS